MDPRLPEGELRRGRSSHHSWGQIQRPCTSAHSRAPKAGKGVEGFCPWTAGRLPASQWEDWSHWGCSLTSGGPLPGPAHTPGSLPTVRTSHRFPKAEVAPAQLPSERSAAGTWLAGSIVIWFLLKHHSSFKLEPARGLSAASQKGRTF